MGIYSNMGNTVIQYSNTVRRGKNVFVPRPSEPPLQNSMKKPVNFPSNTSNRKSEDREDDI